MLRTTLPEFIAAIQNFLHHQNQYITNPSKSPSLITPLREAAAEADKIADRYQRHNLEGNESPTQSDHAGTILWSQYKAAREAFDRYKAKKNSATKNQLRAAEQSLKIYSKAVSESLQKLKL
jgi:hypothetical protein